MTHLLFTITFSDFLYRLYTANLPSSSIAVCVGVQFGDMLLFCNSYEVSQNRLIIITHSNNYFYCSTIKW